MGLEYKDFPVAHVCVADLHLKAQIVEVSINIKKLLFSYYHVSQDLLLEASYLAVSFWSNWLMP